MFLIKFNYASNKKLLKTAEIIYYVHTWDQSLRT